MEVLYILKKIHQEFEFWVGGNWQGVSLFNKSPAYCPLSNILQSQIQSADISRSFGMDFFVHFKV